MAVFNNPNYPLGCTDEEIITTIKSLTDDLVVGGTNLQLAPLAQLGQNELQRRMLDRTFEHSKKTERIATAVAIISVFLTCIAIFLAYISFESDDEWRDAQTQILHSIDKDLVSHNK